MKTKLILMIFIALLLVSCSKSNEVKYQKITPSDAAERLLNEDIILLDVRTQQEHDEMAIKGSLLIPYDTISEETEDILDNKDAVIFVYCRSGNRSEIAANKLIELGYTKVFDLGGIADLANDEYFKNEMTN